VTDIDKLEQLRAAATQGPFVHVTPPPGYSFGFIGYYVEHEGERLRSEFPACDADDAYTVELLNAAPALIAELRRLRSENETLRKIVADCIEQGTDGHAHPACTLEFLSYAPREVAATKRQRDEAREEYDELLRRTEKREEAERIVNAGSLPSHLERAEDRELDRLRAIEAAAREFWNARWAGNVAQLRAALGLKAALAAKEDGK
jgi:hypothetical protein